MSSRYRIAVVGFCTITFAWLVTASAAPPAPRAGEKAVDDALAREAQGTGSGRAALVEAVLDASPNNAAARWHAGYVKYKNRWTKFDDATEKARTNRLCGKYRQVRQGYPDTLQGQLALARWCSQRKLDAEARAHYTRVLDFDPDHAEARRQLGFRRVQGLWMSEEEIRAARERSQRAVAALRHWKPKLEGLRRQFLRRKGKARDAARDKITAISDPAAIPAMELVLSTPGEETAQLAVEALGKMKSYEASISLARHAVFAESVFVRQEALLRLKDRRLDEYIPAMLAAMHTPIQSRAELLPGPRGQLLYRHSFVREGQENRELAVFDTVFERAALPGGDARETLGRAVGGAGTLAAAREASVAEQNVRTEETNRRVCQLMAHTSGEQLPAEPRVWWKWWNEYNDVFVAGSKPLRQTYNRSDVTVADTSIAASSSGASVSMDCLAAGTPVWTLNGPVAIEKIQVGDQVLAQDPETGELAYKPVLRTTIRPSGPLIEIATSRGTIRTSGGHLFWQSGAGWAKSRDLKAGAMLHTVRDVLAVRSVGTGGSEPTYNLIVADFHTYFVGEELILSHDNTIRTPTNAVVPGFVRR